MHAITIRRGVLVDLGNDRIEIMPICRSNAGFNGVNNLFQRPALVLARLSRTPLRRH